jgi:ankyrin repeat protein
VNSAANLGFTPLHAAARFACPKVLELLLADSRVIIDAKTEDGFTALHLVAEGGENHHPHAGIVRPSKDRCQVVGMLLQAEQQRRARNLDCNLNKEDVLKRFPIHYGVECDSVNVMKELLNWEDTNINALDHHGFAPLHLALRSTANHRTVVVEALLQVQNIDVNIASVTPSSDVQPLQMAGKNEGWLDLFFPFQPLEAPQESSTHLTPLHFAAKMGFGRIVDLLFQLPKIELNVQDSRDYTPLHFAAQDGRAEVVQTFLQEDPGRVNFDARDNEGLTPAWRAIWNDRMQVVRLLWDFAIIQEYDRIDILLPKLLTGDQNLTTVRFLVSSFPTDKLVQVIEEMGNPDVLNLETTRAKLLDRLETEVAFPNSSRSPGETLLHWVAKNNYWKLIPQIMISRRQTGGFVNQMDIAQKRTALHYAATHDRGDVVKTLLEHASELDLNLKDRNGDTPLHLATKNGRIDVVKALCQNPDQQRLRANEEDAQGQTCLQYAMEHDNIPKEIANTLMDRSDVKDFVDRHYRDRQVFVDAANALLVGGALIAGLSFASWLQPPLSFTPYYQFPQSTPATPPATYETFAAVELHYSLRLFWTFNNLSFFFAIATVLSGAEAAFPDLDAVFIVKAVKIVRRALIWTSILLVFSVITVLGAFVCAGFAVLPPIARDVNNMTISTAFGMLVCCVVLFKFSAKLFGGIFKIIKRPSEKS